MSSLPTEHPARLGLTEAEAARRLAAEGPNELPSQKPRGVLAIALEVVKEPMFLMLLAAGGLYLAMGEPGDAVLLLCFVFVVMTITIVQERRTERALDALRDLSSPRALVIRDGERRRIAGREVVRGDLLVLAEGDRVPADALLREGAHLSADESLLTGESVPVRKHASPSATALDRPGGDDLPSLFSGTLVTGGQGTAEVVSTGFATELGKIGKALHTIEAQQTPLQAETGRLVKRFAAVGLGLCTLVVLVYALARGGSADVWKQGLLAGIAMAMATLPEEFPVVLTVFLALGAWRISKSRVLTRRMPAVETLGSATVLCVDKTGTLTQNQMTVARLVVGSEERELAGGRPGLPAPFLEVARAAVLASKQDPFDPMERAIHSALALLEPGAQPFSGRDLVHEFPLSPSLLAVTQAFTSPGSDAVQLFCKGAPEAVARLCRLSPERGAALDAQVAALAARGLRVLGVARGSAASEAALPQAHADLSLSFDGLVGLEDPLRLTVPAAVQECQAAGIRVVMITGDYPATAQSIARQAGLASPDLVITGPELETLSTEALRDRLAAVSVFARVVPEQKLKIVEAFKARGEVVAMTGDGVNDAPALKAAHIGIAMGGRGTDVAREAAALVLLDDDFSSIVAAVRLGRRIFDNIRKAIAFVVAVHIPIAGLSVIPVFFPGWPLLLLPVHIVFLELVIDPSCTLIFESEEAEPTVMARPPRDPREPLFSAKALGLAAAQGVAALAACLAIFLYGKAAHGPDAARALAFATLVVCALGIILSNRSWTRPFWRMFRVPNAALRYVVGGSALMLALVLALPQARSLFHFAPVDPADLAVALGAGVACLLGSEALKQLRAPAAAGSPPRPAVDPPAAGR
ncbi:MAG TPA: cation-translocating P-type ATPase [Myxococcales bacterium]|jgi:Ca2+-transporting ATPase